MNDIIIKPWHPFLRILQGFFKSDKGKILDRYQGEDNNKLIVEFISCRINFISNRFEIITYIISGLPRAYTFSKEFS